MKLSLAQARTLVALDEEIKKKEERNPDCPKGARLSSSHFIKDLPYGGANSASRNNWYIPEQTVKGLQKRNLIHTEKDLGRFSFHMRHTITDLGREYLPQAKKMVDELVKEAKERRAEAIKTRKRKEKEHQKRKARFKELTGLELTYSGACPADFKHCYIKPSHFPVSPHLNSGTTEKYTLTLQSYPVDVETLPHILRIFRESLTEGRGEAALRHFMEKPEDL